MLGGSPRWAAFALLIYCGRSYAQPATEPAKAPDSGAPAVESEGSVADPRAAAHTAYARGQELFAQGKYADAKGAFDQAYVLVPNPVVLLSTAECDVRLGNIEQAHAQLQRYLSQRPDAPDRAAIEEKATELSARPAMLLLSSEPGGAAVQIDGAEVGTQTPAAILVTPGEHRISFSLSGQTVAQEVVQAHMGARQSVRVRLGPASNAPSALPLRSTALSAPASSAGAEIWITGIVGGAGIAAGTVLGIMALNERDEFNHMPSTASADRGERLALFADVAFAVGAVSLITTAVLCLTADNDTSERVPRGGSGSVALSAAALPQGAGLTASGRF